MAILRIFLGIFSDELKTSLSRSLMSFVEGGRNGGAAQSGRELGFLLELVRRRGKQRCRWRVLSAWSRAARARMIERVETGASPAGSGKDGLGALVR
jgi:hypothetical protein